MGRRKSSIYNQDLRQQVYDRMTAMLAFGESKSEAKKLGDDKGKIFAHDTYRTYWKHAKYFVCWVEKYYPEITSLKAARKLVPVWLQLRVDQGLSASTIAMETSALNKIYGIEKDNPYRFKPPARKREDITRSRFPAERDKNFSEDKNRELINFAQGTGCRRHELKKLKGKDLMTREQIEGLIAENARKIVLSKEEILRRDMLIDTRLFEDTEYFFFTKGKGGKERISPIIGDHVGDIVRRFRETAPNEKVWKKVSSNADIHSYRADYATAIYKKYARKIEDIPYDRRKKGTNIRYQSEVYTCRKDKAGDKYDKRAMLRASKALGHNRISIVASNYLRGV